MSKNIKYVGIDFGSSNTCVVGISENNKVVEFCANELQTVIYANGKEKKYLGEAYKKYSTDENLNEEHYNLEFKESLLNGESIESEIPQEFFKAIYKKIEETYKDYQFDNINQICYGYPNCYDENKNDEYCKKMDDYISIAFVKEDKKKVKKVEEPVLATAAYFYENSDKFEKDKIVLTLDFGGYTLDMSLCKVLKNGNLIEIHPIINSISQDKVWVGKAFTLDLCVQIYEENVFFDSAVEKAKCELFERENYDSEPPVEIRPKKKSEKYLLKYNIKELTNGKKIIGFLRREGYDFESRMKEIVNLVTTYTANCDKIDYVLFTGGSANITPIRVKIIESLKNKYGPLENAHIGAGDSEEKFSLGFNNAVAYGAALVAAGKVEILKKVKNETKEVPHIESNRYTTIIQELKKQIVDLKKNNNSVV